jgi:hypothetical protein
MIDDVPQSVQPGDLIGIHLPTSIAAHPHPGLIIQIYNSVDRDKLVASRGLHANGDDLLCLMLMISHSQPPRGEPAEYIPIEHRVGTHLDPNEDLFISYRHFDAALIPQRSLIIGSIRKSYLGQMRDDAWRHYKSQFTAVQSVIKGRSSLMPRGLWT